MINKIIPVKIIAIFILSFAILSCRESRYGSKKKGEQNAIGVYPGIAIDTNKLQMQLAYNDGKIRGAFFDPTTYGTTALSIVTTGVKKAIAQERKKYQASYEFNIGQGHDTCRHLQNDSLYFYSKHSSVGPFDIKNMQFTGLTVARLIGPENKKELAFRGYFELDTSNLCEIATDGIFRLRLKQFELHYARAKVPRGKKKINMEIEVQFFTSYISKDGRFYANELLGKFTKTLNGVAIKDTASFRKFENKKMDGSCFVVPRSYYYSHHGGDMWNQGAYSIRVIVKEISNQKYVNALAADGSGKFIDAIQNGINVNNIMAPVTGNKVIKK